MFGKFFIENRYMSMPIILTLPVIGILERYGLKRKSRSTYNEIKRSNNWKSINVIFYDKRIISALGLNIGGHAQTVRPLVAPMAEGPRKVNTVNFLKN